MSLGSLGSLARGSIRAWSSSSPGNPGIVVARGFRFLIYHADGHKAAAALPSFVGSRAVHSMAAAHTGPSGGGGRRVVLAGGGGVVMAVAALTTMAAYFFLRSGEPDDEDLPDHVDWSKMGAVTEAKRQGDCGNCWAHAAVGAIEGCHKIETGKLVELSVQQMTDCARNGCYGCNGGWPIGAFWFALSGVTTAAVYPQREDMWHGPCCSKGMVPPAVKISRFSFTSGEESLMRAVARQPVVVLLDGHEALSNYTGGIISYEMWPTIDHPEYRHAVLAVGYGTDEFGVRYWKLKNSYGPSWGEGGYFRIERGVPTKFGVAGIKKGLGIYPHMSWFGKKVTKGSSEKVAKGSAVTADGATKGPAVKNADEDCSIGGRK